MVVAGLGGFVSLVVRGKWLFLVIETVVVDVKVFIFRMK